MAATKNSTLKKFRSLDWKNIRYTTLLFAGFLAYVFGGGLMFYSLEGTPNEVANYTSVNETALQYEYAKHLWLKSRELEESEWIPLVLEGIQQYRVEVNAAYAREEAATRHQRWSFFSACFFCITVISTIGYGIVTPSTPGGRLACIFYAMIGIPLFVILLAKVGKLISTALQYVYRKYTDARKHYREIVRQEKRREEGSFDAETRGVQCDSQLREESPAAVKRDAGTQYNDGDRHLPVMMPEPAVEEVTPEEEGGEEPEQYNDAPVTLFVVICVAWIIAGSAIVATVFQPEWSYLDAFYFTIITFTTVGFGDLVIHDPTVVPPDQLVSRQTFLSVYIVIGLVVMSITLNLAQEQLNATAQRIAEQKLQGETIKCSCRSPARKRDRQNDPIEEQI